jgi:hypothetical protein
MILYAQTFSLVKFIVQVIISFTVLIFSIFMLIKFKQTEVYLPVLTGIVGYWLPQPSLKYRTNEPVNRV